MSAADEGRTEQATTKQREKFRDEGSVAKSVEFNSLFSYLAGFAVFSFLGAFIVHSVSDMMRYAFVELVNFSVAQHLQALTRFYFENLMLLLLPLFAVLFASVILVNILQFGFKISWKAAKPKFSKVNPLANFKKVLLSSNSLIELVKSLIKLGAVSFLIYLAVQPLLLQFPSLSQFTPLQIGIKTWEFAATIWIMFILFTALLGIADFAWQKHQMEEKMKMRPNEVEDEMKQMEGNPEIKKKQRIKGMQMLQNLMAQKTQEADVIITNPTHFAVALKYRHGEMNAPKVVAKGIDHLAMKIRKIARHAEIPIVENRGLARALYYAAEIDSDIPERLFRPVAEILAFIFRLNKERAAHG